MTVARAQLVDRLEAIHTTIDNAIADHHNLGQMTDLQLRELITFVLEAAQFAQGLVNVGALSNAEV